MRSIALEGFVRKASVRVLVVDDYEDWRRFGATTLQKEPEWQVVGEACDGLQAIQLVRQLQPDLVLMDIGLPKLSGIEAARKIRHRSPHLKIIFLSDNRDWDIAEEALSTGAAAYVVKRDAASELLPAAKTVLEGNLYISASLAGLSFASYLSEAGSNTIPSGEKDAS